MPASPPPPPGALPMAAGGVPPPASQALWSARLVDLLNLVRHEFDVIGNDAVHFKSQRDELEHRSTWLLLTQSLNNSPRPASCRSMCTSWKNATLTW